MRVAVVGAGLAGLRAASRLTGAGVEVHLVEGGGRVGGRVRTVRAPFADGQYVESGAEWVDTDHPLMLELLDRFGIGLQGDGQDWTTLRRMLFRQGVLCHPDDLRREHPTLDDELDRYEAVFEQFAEGIADPAHPDRHPDAARLDARSAADVAREAGLGEVAALFARRNAQGEFAAEPEEVSALFVAQQRKVGAKLGVSSGHRSHRVDGGFSRLAEAMAAELPDAVLSLGEPVTAIEWHEAGATVVTASRRLEVDRVIITCSLVALRRVRFTPEMPPDLRAAVDGLGYGTVTKTAVQWPARTWTPGFVNCDLTSQRMYEPTMDLPGTAGVLMAYTGGEGGRRLAERDEAARIEQVVADQRTIHGLAGDPLGAFSRAWSSAPRFGGSYAVYRPGEVVAHWQVLRRPCGPLRLAGEHTATWTGYLEGALETADRACAAILAE